MYSPGCDANRELVGSVLGRLIKPVSALFLHQRIGDHGRKKLDLHTHFVVVV